jgi:hypothetical protein
MILTLTIEKDDAKDCPYDCPFRDEAYSDKNKCTLFNDTLEREGYYDSLSTVACRKCQILYNKAIAQQPHAG